MMLRISLSLLLSTLSFFGSAQQVPDWFLNDINRMEGTWITDNSAYMSDQEPITNYKLTWKKSLDGLSMTGLLTGIDADKNETVYWEFRQYWDNYEEEAILMQFGLHNFQGKGTIVFIDDNKTETYQRFSFSQHSLSHEKHETVLDENKMITTSFYKADGKWQKKRTYTWQKEKKDNNMDLGTFSLSLSVKDIKASLDFYQKLGFSQLDGNIDQNWLILKNGNIKIGLFQGMFPQNTITFNPEDGRAIYEQLKAVGVGFSFANGVEKESGPCSFILSDPDGNPILVDQH